MLHAVAESRATGERGRESVTKYSGPFIELKRMAAELGVGETKAGLTCVFCNGGSTRERSFSVTRSDEATALYCCHRASCSRKGRVACPGYRLLEQVQPKKPVPSTHVYPYTEIALGYQWRLHLWAKYGLTADEVIRAHWRETKEDGGLVIPLRDRFQSRVGAEVRYKTWVKDGSHNGPKTRIFYEQPVRTPNFFWPQSGSREGPVVVVEDALSALKVSRLYIAAALHGSHLSRVYLDEIFAASPHLVLALDNDATFKAFDYQKDFGIYGNFKVAVLGQDLKYEEDAQIKTIVESAR